MKLVSSILTSFYPGTGKQPFPWIHISDIIGLYDFAIENEEIEGVMNGVAPELVNYKEFAQKLSASTHFLGGNVIPINMEEAWPLPAQVVKFIFGPIRSKLLLQGQQVIPKKAQQFNYQWKHPKIEEALKSLRYSNS
jgi:uncharacterized protein